MYGVAATLYHLLTGNSPDKMGRSNFLWPPQGEKSLTPQDRSAWTHLHRVIRHACEDMPTERYVDFRAMAEALNPLAASQKTLSRPLIRGLSLLGVAAAAVVVAFREKIAEWKPKDSPSTHPATSVRELTEEEKNDYRVLVGLSEAYLTEGNYANALATIETLLFKYPQSRSQPQYSATRAMALIGLGRKEEAVEELKSDVHLSPEIAAASMRNQIWKQLNEWGEAENDLTRILEKFGPNTLLLFMRAQARIMRENIPGAWEDQQSAYQIRDGSLEQKRLVDLLWKPLVDQYPAYAEYVQTKNPDEAKETKPSNDRWVMDNWDDLMKAIVEPGQPVSAQALRGRAFMVQQMKDYISSGNYLSALSTYDEITYSLEELQNQPIFSLYRAYLLHRLQQPEKVQEELARTCHRNSQPQNLEQRVMFLNLIERIDEAYSLCDRAIEGKVHALEGYYYRAILRISDSNFTGADKDRATLFSLLSDENADQEKMDLWLKRWETVETSHQGYADYRKNLLQK